MTEDPFAEKLFEQPTAAESPRYVGVVGVHPANLAHGDIGTAIGLMLFSVAVSVGGGHAMYHSFRTGYLLSRRLDARTASLPATAVRVGLCFEMQIVEEMPAEPHDMMMSMVITEVGMTQCEPRILAKAEHGERFDQSETPAV